jgi:hypothetical protein
MRIKPLHLILGAVAGFVGYEVYKKYSGTPRPGDDVLVQLTDVAAPEIQAAVRLLPAGGVVDMQVSNVSSGTLSGTAKAYLVNQLSNPQSFPLPPIPMQVAKSAVNATVRDGKQV